MLETSRQAEKRPILVVEDDADLRDSLCDVLRDEGYAAEGAANGQDALAWLQSHARPPLILLDLMMPIMDGAVLRERMLQSEVLREIPVVVLSALDVSRQQDSVAGAAGYLKKPVDPSELLATVARLATPGGTGGVH